MHDPSAPTGSTEPAGGPAASAVPRALTIAGSDSGGGAGIQADLKTFAALGVWGMSAITSITVQNTLGVSGVADVAADVVGAQIRVVATDIGVDAAKTGMLSSTPIVEAVAIAVAECGIPNLVVDPVFVSKHGHRLLREDAVEALRALMLPLATLVTPNLPEAEGLAGFEVTSRERMQDAASAILDLGAKAVLVKGGHLAGDRADDLFADRDGSDWIRAERIDTPNTHGTGCVLSAAIAGHLAAGEDLVGAVRKGKAFVTEAIRHSLAIGRGIGPVDPGWAIGATGVSAGPDAARGRP
ncbi:MAG TPA: bifunctional hydroxymethylpyrimidine kinase/phosphomethylpyrimidine kinase [Actinomycetota bacterium]|nr:bifunctional hydroxymethylpyrimidine kinase/phosphomethylpyrimidine kinase [Actinomycetota bacterium]